MECSTRVCTNVLSVSVLRHGDDFATLATRTQIAEFKEHLSKHLLVKHTATLGPRPQLLHDSCEVRFLNRVIRWVVPPFGKAPERIEIEADPRHSELLIKNFGLQTNSKGVNTPGERTRNSSCIIKLSPQDSTSYRSDVMRLANLSVDRIELQLASKEFARSRAEPTTADVEALKRCIRFLLKSPRCIQSFERQETVPKQITCYSDSNFAGCLQSRKSTSSCKIFYGKHLLKSERLLSSTQFSLNSCSQSGKSCNRSLRNSSSFSFIFVFSISADPCDVFHRDSSFIISLLSVAGFSVLSTVSCDEDVEETKME